MTIYDINDRILNNTYRNGVTFMTRILVLSDSHGDIENMVQAVSLSQPDMIFHLGDCWQDADKLRLHFPDMRIEQVQGNCDCRMEAHERIIIIEGKRIFMCHGHDYSVKMGYYRVMEAAQEAKADVLLFGHTHRIYYDYHNNMAILNPGSIGVQRAPGRPTYGILEIDGDKVHVDEYCL